jgi:hypothetical protein
MSITCVEQIGQSGNRLFPQILCSLTARIHKLRCKEFENELVDFHHVEIQPTETEISLITSNPLHDLKEENVNVVMKRSYYQNYLLFWKYRDYIKTNIVKLPKVSINKKDIVLHLRLDGFNHKGHDSHCISPLWYVNILENEVFENLYIVMATKKGQGRVRLSQTAQKQKYLEQFKKFNYTIISEDCRHDFNYIRSFDKIICSNSTFCWWASFLSDASKIYTPPVWEGRNSDLSGIGETIDKNFRYINVDTMELL